MPRALILNLSLLLIAALLGLAVWLSRAPQTPALTRLDPAGIESIEISDRTGRHILLQRQAGQWRIDGKPADQTRVTRLLRICRTPSLERFPAPPSLQPYGLDPAPLLLRLNGETLAFGTTDPVNGWRYVLTGQTVHLIADGFYHHLIAPPGAWLETR